MSGTVSIYKHPKSNKIYLDINFNGKRKRQSTKLEKTNANLKLVEKEIIPKIQIDTNFLQKRKSERPSKNTHKICIQNC